MLILNSKQFVNPEMSKYIKEQTNKWLISLQEKHSNKPNYISGLRVSDLVKQTDIEPKLPNNYFILPFVSLISFLAGYKFCNLIHK
jgi:hypothetical protein